MSFQRFIFRSLIPASVSQMRVITGFTTLCIFILILFGGSAWSFEKTSIPTLPERTSNAHNTSYIQKVPSSTVADSCLPLLKSFQHAPSISAIDRTQLPAGKVAVLSMALGVRHALGPLENPALSQTAETSLSKPSYTAATQNNLRALKIAAYRTCQKEQALQAQAKMQRALKDG